VGLLKPASGGSYLKAGILGFAKSGKTHTGMLELALGTREFFKLDGPAAMFDTEDGSAYLKDRVKERTGHDLLVVKGRSLEDLLATTKECIELGVSVLVVDSITHVWREVCEAYLEEVRRAARKKNWREPDRLEFQDWGKIKTMWARWPDLYLTSPLHIVVCGRAGFEYDFETDERGKKELVKTGVKMKVEGEFGFEPSLLIEMERLWVDGEAHEMMNRATVIGDRFDALNGKQCDKPTFKFFEPHVAKLSPASHAPVDTKVKTKFGLDENRADDRKREMDRREILAEKITAALSMAGMAGQSADDKKARAETFKKYWGSTSWKEISERTASAVMEQALRRFELDHGLMNAEDDLPADMSVKDVAPTEGDIKPEPDAAPATESAS
jgi:hypothetical protein